MMINLSLLFAFPRISFPRRQPETPWQEPKKESGGLGSEVFIYKVDTEISPADLVSSFTSTSPLPFSTKIKSNAILI